MIRIAVLLLLFLPAACGEDGPCDSYGTRACQKACACADGCRVLVGSAVQPYASLLACTDALTRACQDSGRIDIAACTSALRSARCVTAGGMEALELPPACLP